MMIFTKGDILVGTQRSFDQAFHKIVYIDGSLEAPRAVVLTRSKGFKCNFQMAGDYGVGKGCSYFVGHLIEKIPDWGPYKKIGNLNANDLAKVEAEIGGRQAITWHEYETLTKGKCPIHP